MQASRAPSEIESIAKATFQALREMDRQSEFGLSNFVSCSPFAGKKKKDESAITWGLTEALRCTWNVEPREHGYPEGGGRCDRVFELADGSRLWLEIKLAWRRWFYEVVKENAPFFYEGYFGGMNHKHSVSGDFDKLEQIRSYHGRYVALLVVGFDGDDGKMVDDVAELIERDRLIERKWNWLAEAWPAQQNLRCWNRCWFAWRETLN